MIKEYINKTLEPPQLGTKQVRLFKNMAAIWFMGLRPMTAMLHHIQYHTVGASELGMHLKTLGIKDSAQRLLTKSELDIRLGKLTPVEKQVLDIAAERGLTWQNASQTSMFRDIDPSSSKQYLGARLAKVTEISLSMFKAVEQHVRQSAILTAYRIFSKGSEEFNQEAFDKAVKFNNNVNFIMNKGNVPYWAMKNPIGQSAYTLMSYTMNMANWMLNRAHGSLSDLEIDKWTQRQAFMKMLGYAAVLAGASGLPFEDDLNKAIRKVFGRDLHLEAKTFIKKHSNEDIANLVSDGVFAPAGIKLSSHMGLHVPFLSGMLDDQTIGESVSGVAGNAVTKGENAISAAYNGQGRAFVEAMSPEFVASALRAERLHREGQRDREGKKVFYKGQPIKLTGPEAVLQGLTGIKSERKSNIADITESEYKLTDWWKGKKSIAEAKARRGDISAVQEYNRDLVKDKNARRLVPPIKLSGLNKPNKEKTGFEVSQ
jgi:hypothetical protein